MTQAEKLQCLATGRDGSLFAQDIVQNEDRLKVEINGKRILLIGAAGTIGSSTLMQIASRCPHTLHIIDQNENGLAELVRQMRSQPFDWHAEDFQTLPLDYGSHATRHFLHAQEPYDAVLNFAALKHVRTEKDPYSTLQMFETNLIRQARFMNWLGETGFSGRLFSVSTDKAANPTSMMGATKRVMEHVLFNSSVADGLGGTTTSARFANVAFSNGSLPLAFCYRFERNEPLAVPKDTRRYFVSIRESGEICLLAAFLAPNKSIAIPKLNPEDHLVFLQDIAEQFLRHYGYEAAHYANEEDACRSVESEKRKGRWPLLLTALNTAGEKPFEEFVADNENTLEFGMKSLMAVRYVPQLKEVIDQSLIRVSDLLEQDGDGTPLSKDVLKEIIASVEPAFLKTHRETGKNLDQRL